VVGTLPSVNQVAKEADGQVDLRQGKNEHHRQGGMVRMPIPAHRTRQPSRLPSQDLGLQALDAIVSTFGQQMRQTLIRPMQKMHRIIRHHAQGLQRRQGLIMAAGAPALPILDTQAPAPLQITLRPGIVVAVGGEYHSHLSTARQYMLNQTGSAQAFIIRVRRKNQQTLC